MTPPKLYAMLRGRRFGGPLAVGLRCGRKQQALFEARSAKVAPLSHWAFPQNFEVRGVEAIFLVPAQKDCVLTTFILAAPFALPAGLVSFLPFILIIVVFWLLLIRPNQKKQQAWQKMLQDLKTGDRITTSGGIRGTILNIREDTIQLRIPPDNIKIEVVKSAIASVTTDEVAK